MANEFKGEVALTYEGKSYKMTLDFNAFCDFESETGKNALLALEGMERGEINASDMRALMWAGLRQHHEDLPRQRQGHVLVVLAGKILSKNIDAVARASAAASPEGEDAGNAPAPKPRKKRVTGGRP